MAAVTEEERHDMANSLEAQLGRETAMVLLKHLPPTGWADVATTRDLDLLESRLEARMNAMHASTLKWTVGMMITQTGVIAAIVSLLR